MSIRSRCSSLAAVAVTLLLATGAAIAQTDTSSRAELEAQIKSVELALNRIQLEQQSVHQQFQMIQEMRRTELEQIQQSALVYTPEPTPPNYDDMVRKKQAREARLQDYQYELDRLYARYRELEEQKRPLLDELSQLATQRR
jgi:hypothetical protein